MQPILASPHHAACTSVGTCSPTSDIGLLVFLCAVALALCACGGGSGGSSASGSSENLANSKYVGTWKVDTISLKEVSEEFDTEWTLILEADGTGKSISEDEESSFTWKITDKGFKTSGDVKTEFVEDGDSITTKILGAELRFNKAE